jgi:hypothetical protein
VLLDAHGIDGQDCKLLTYHFGNILFGGDQLSSVIQVCRCTVVVAVVCLFNDPKFGVLLAFLIKHNGRIHRSIQIKSNARVTHLSAGLRPGCCWHICCQQLRGHSCGEYVRIFCLCAGLDALPDAPGCSAYIHTKRERGEFPDLAHGWYCKILIINFQLCSRGCRVVLRMRADAELLKVRVVLVHVCIVCVFA